jgi:integrase
MLAYVRYYPLIAAVKCGNECGSRELGKLTAVGVKAAKEPGRYTDGDGLMLLVSKTGSKSWVVRVQVDGKRRDFGLGSADLVSLADARSKAQETRRLCLEGRDPLEEKKAAQLARRGKPTFGEAAHEAHREQVASWKNAKHRAQWINTLETYAFPFIGEHKVDKITGPMVRELLLPIWLEKPETARRVRQRVAAVLDWAHANGFRDTEAPVRSISKGLPKQPKRDRHFAAMPYESLPAFMASLKRVDSVGRLALRFVILTAARSGEVRGAVWEEMDLQAQVWRVPAERMKMGREHIVPLVPEALNILQTCEAFQTGRAGAPVFPGIGGRPLSDGTLTKILRDAGIENATVHGFRSGFRDWAAEQTNTPGEVVEAALAHTVANRVEAAYRRTNYLEKRRGLMLAWASFLT